MAHATDSYMEWIAGRDRRSGSCCTDGVLKQRGDSWDGKEQKMYSVFLSQNQSLLAPCWCDNRKEEPKMVILSKLSENMGG